jgi:hypothetical protein
MTAVLVSAADNPAAKLLLEREVPTPAIGLNVRSARAMR